ncbi:hypothetical protein C0992_006480 [Termitomyces sp. T32_za158]|nr:hypothetical protein C0992_006480 [Termitomyces sp. T32_za158]
MVEEVGKELAPMASLPADAPVIMISEEEFQGTLERGDGPDRPRMAERKAVKKPDKARQPDETRAEQRVDKGKAKITGLREEDIPRLHQQWQQEFADIVNGTKPELPPWREVNHEINLIDKTKQYKYHLPRCPRALQEQLWDKTNRYINAKWWEPRPAMQAAPLLCIPKKDGTLQTALDA